MKVNEPASPQGVGASELGANITGIWKIYLRKISFSSTRRAFIEIFNAPFFITKFSMLRFSYNNNAYVPVYSKFSVYQITDTEYFHADFGSALLRTMLFQIWFHASQGHSDRIWCRPTTKTANWNKIKSSFPRWMYPENLGQITGNLTGVRDSRNILLANEEIATKHWQVLGQSAFALLRDQ